MDQFRHTRFSKSLVWLGLESNQTYQLQLRVLNQLYYLAGLKQISKFSFDYTVHGKNTFN